MKSKDYEYSPVDGEEDISDKRKKELISKLKNQINKGFIAHYLILDMGKNDVEYDFIYNWLDQNEVMVRGINSTISGEIPNYKHIPKVGQSKIPPVLDEKEAKELFEKLREFSKDDIEKGNPEALEIRRKLIEGNMALAKWVANWSNIKKIPLSTEDKRQMAMISLIKAVDTFNPDLGFKFSTYATKCINRGIISQCYHSGADAKMAIRLREQTEAIIEIENSILMNLGRPAKPYEIADIIGVSLKKLDEIRVVQSMMSRDSLENRDEEENSLDSIVSSLDDGDRIEYNKDEGIYIKEGVYTDEASYIPIEGVHGSIPITEHEVYSNLLRNDLKTLLQTLTPREEAVLTARFGLVDGTLPKNLEEVGMMFGITRERTRQIEAKGLRKLRHPSRAKQLREYCDLELG